MHLCNCWIDLFKTGRTFDGLLDLILQEQILQSCFKEVVIFLRERKFQSVEELVKAGETYSVAHPGSPIARKSVSNLWSESATANECLRLHPSTSSPVPVFVYVRPHLSPSWCQMVGPEGVGCLSDVLHHGSGNHRGMRVLSFCSTSYSSR